MLGFEDLDLALRLREAGMKIDQCSAHLAHHEDDTQFVSYLRKRTRYARGAREFRLRHPQGFRELASPLRRVQAYLSNLTANPDIVVLLLAPSFRHRFQTLRHRFRHILLRP